MKYDIFISYSRKDIEFARKVCAVLDSYKQYYDFEYFFDQSEITSRDEYLKRISSAILESRVVLFLASKNSYDAEFCAKELLFADKRGVHIHQYRIDKAEMPLELDMLLGTHQYRELKSTPIERMVQEVLEDALNYKVLPFAELNPYKKIIKLGAKLVFNSFRTSIFAPINLIKQWELLKSKRLPIDTKVTKVYEVGDYYDDGKRQGVVFEVSEDGKHGKIVSLQEALLKWCTDEQYEKTIVIGANSYIDGKFNTDIVMQRGDYAEYPAFKWCRELGEEWYLPSRDELQAIYNLKGLLDQTLAKYSHKEINVYWCWSSTEYNDFCANLIGSYDRLIYHNQKSLNSYVRAVSAF